MLFASGCRKEASYDPVPVYQPTPFALEVPFGFPTLMNIPEDNPLTVEGIELGRYLFYDGRLSGRTHPDSLMCCATCHLQERAFECGIDHPRFTGGFPFGLTGEPTPDVMLPLINLVWNGNGYLWNGKIGSLCPGLPDGNLEDLTWMGILAPHEMHGDTLKSRELIQSIPGYPTLFGKAFGSQTVTVRNMGRAIAQFVRTLVSADSKFDRYLKGEVQLSPSELNGFVLFSTEEGGDCFHCHGGSGNPLFTTHLFYNNGKDSTFTADVRDRYHVTGDPMDIGAYKVPTLRNVIFTAPYMHDGRFGTLDEVLAFYNEQLVWSPYISTFMHHIGEGGVHLTPFEVADLKAFILTLTDSSFTVKPEFSKPDHFPGELY
jgi:cytochrome c peroxidase